MTEADRRLELDAKLREILGSNNVYFQPPETMKLQFPCIIYSKNAPNIRHANDGIYTFKQSYSVMVADKNPESEIPMNLIKSLQYCRIDSNFTKDHMNQTKLTLFY